MNGSPVQGLKRTTIFVASSDTLVPRHSAKTVPHVRVDRHFSDPVPENLISQL